MTSPRSTPLRTLVEGLDGIADRPIPYGRLPRSFSDYADEFVRWTDLADQTRNTLTKRPRIGDAAVDALVAAAREAMQAQALAAHGGRLSAEHAVTALLDRLDDGDAVLLDGRRWTDPPVNLATLATQLDTSTTSLSRRLPRADQRLAELLDDPLHNTVRDYATRLADELGSLAPDELTVAALRGLRVDPASQTARLLLHVAGPYQPAAPGWTENAGAGGHHRTQTVVDNLFAHTPAPSQQALRNELVRAGLSDEASWAFLRSQTTWRRFGDVYVQWNPGSTADMAEAVLHATAEPLTASDIHAAIGTDTVSIYTVTDALREHRCFVRASRRTWALAAWNLDHYTNIADAIGTTIDRLGGSATADDIAAGVLARFPDVAESSVRSFLHTLAFVHVGSSYRRRQREDTFNGLPALRRTRGAFRNGDNEVRYALVIDDNLLRGSATRLPPAVANAAGVQPGQRKTFTNPAGDITVHWQLSSIHGTLLSSLRAHALASKAQHGDTLVLAFDPDHVAITCIPVHTVGLARLKALLGRRIRNPAAALAASLQCTRNEVAVTLRRRGDHDLADSLDLP
ncbi:hypothetical protein FIV07_28115 (plasmid) [Mycobacterium sp. THAF192]|nr:hypothetical protein FIV07_28115 [Mycobacterium sp. THAF192]